MARIERKKLEGEKAEIERERRNRKSTKGFVGSECRSSFRER